MISNSIVRSIPSAQSQKLRLWLLGILNHARLSTWSRNHSARHVLSIAVQEIIYCTCGHLMTDDSAENRKYISAVLDTFSIPNFYKRKGWPHGHRYGKALGCKEYHAANQLARKCRKKKYDSIHDRFIRDKTFRKAMIEVGRSEKIIKEMDQLASEKPHSQRHQSRN